jgi:hypothetical protein
MSLTGDRQLERRKHGWEPEASGIAKGERKVLARRRSGDSRPTIGSLLTIIVRRF